MNGKYFLPLFLGGSAVVGYLIYKKLTEVPRPPTPTPTALPPTEPGITVKKGSFEVFLPISAISDTLKGLTGKKKTSGKTGGAVSTVDLPTVVGEVLRKKGLKEWNWPASSMSESQWVDVVNSIRARCNQLGVQWTQEQIESELARRGYLAPGGTTWIPSPIIGRV